MTNKEIAEAFQDLGSIMELHGENPFKIRSYQNAYLTLRKLERPLSAMTDEEISQIKGIGSAISGKIRELLDKGQMNTLEKYRAQTPAGIQEMLRIKGFGPKKVAVIWKELGIDTIGELLYAVNENRLVELKGFGQKTQEDLRQKLEYFIRSRDSFHYASLEGEALAIMDAIAARLPGARASLCGALRRRCNVLDAIEILIAYEGSPDPLFAGDLLMPASAERGDELHARTPDGLPVRIYRCTPQEFGSRLFRLSGAPGFTEAFSQKFPGLDAEAFPEELDLFEKAGIPYIEPELREQDWSLGLALAGQLPALIGEKDVRGVLHAHSTYSDGLNSLGEMARYAQSHGFAYLGITDHSKTAFYARGLQPERVLEQMEEIDRLNAQLAPFRIFKGIESDILSDGSLDYDEDILRRFDFVIASVHSNLRMDEAKATRRLITAIENPYTSILGHPTGRLLLYRQGYPIDHASVIDACAANGVAIEINAHPYRLDLDWSWIPYALEKGVRIAINPDAHSCEGIHDIRYGVLSARKGGLTAGQCLNSLGAEEFAAWCKR